MPTLAEKEKFKRCTPLMREHYAKGDLNVLAEMCDKDVKGLQQWARCLGLKRDKAVAKQTRIKSLKLTPSHNGPTGRRQRFVRGPGNQKIYELLAMQKPLSEAGFEELASLNDMIIHAIKGGAAYDNFLNVVGRA